MRVIFQFKSCHQQLRITISTKQSHKHIKPRFLSTISNQPITNRLTPEFKLIHLLKDIKTSLNSIQTDNHQDEKKIIQSLNSSIQVLKENKEDRVKRLGIYGDRISGRDQLINCLLCDPLNQTYHQTTDQLLNSRDLNQTGLIRIRYGTIVKWNQDKSILEIPNQWLKENNLEIIEDQSFKTLEENDLHLLIIDNLRKEIQPQIYFKLLHFNEFLIGINQIGYQKPQEKISFKLPQSLISLNFPKPFEINTFKTLNSLKTFKSDISVEDFESKDFYKLREEINSISTNPNQKLKTSISIGRLSLSSLSQTLLKSTETLIELETLIIKYEEKIKTIKNEIDKTINKIDENSIRINENQIQELFNKKLKWWKVFLFSIDLGEIIRNFNCQEDFKLNLLLSYQSGQLSIYSKTLKTLTEEILQTDSPLISSITKNDLLISLNQNQSQFESKLQNLSNLPEKEINLERFINIIKQEYSRIYLKYSTISIGFMTILGFSLWGNWIEIQNFIGFLGVFLGISWSRINMIWKKRGLRKGLKDWNRSKDLIYSKLKEKEKDLIEIELFKTNENLIKKFKEILKFYQHQNSLERFNLNEFIKRLNQLEIEIQNPKTK